MTRRAAPPPPPPPSQRPAGTRITGAQRPRSAASFGLCLVALAAGLALCWAITPGSVFSTFIDVPYAPIFPCLGIVLVIAVAERVFPRLRSPSAAGMAGARLRRAAEPARVAVKLLGLLVTLALVAFAYWLFPEYHGTFYEPFWRFLMTLSPLAVAIPVYFYWADSRALEPDDEYLAFGRLCLGRAEPEDRPRIRRHLLGWTVKAFFLPLMTVYLFNDLSALHRMTLEAKPGFISLYDVLFKVSYIIDLLFCVVGYSAATRLFDSEIRSAEPTVAGWVIALICYEPFVSVTGRFYLQYDDHGIIWDNWLASVPALQLAWGIAILALSLLYALSTVAFGLRFSNLTHRGIITSGPYRFSKHPAYVTKNLSWWLMSVPFVNTLGAGTALRNCALLALWNLVYYARARTEERHLSRDPTYVAYALWMNEHGMFRGLARLLPFLRYRPPAADASTARDPA